MFKKQQTGKFFLFDRVPSRGSKRPAPPTATRFRFVVALAFVGLFAIAGAPTSPTLLAQVQAQTPNGAPTSTRFDSTYSAPTPTALGATAAPIDSTDPVDAFNRRSRPIRNERASSQTFAVAVDQDPAIVGAQVFRLLPRELREQSSWRYDAKSNTITVCGPDAALQAAGDLIRQHDARQYAVAVDSFVVDDAASDFVATTGVVPASPNGSAWGDSNKTAQTAYVAGRSNGSNAPNGLNGSVPANGSVGANGSARPRARYYDPDRNEFVRVAYQADGAIVPPRNDGATVFGADAEAPLPETTPAQTAGLLAGSEVADRANDPDSMLEVVSYSCLPTQIDAVERLARTQFASNPEIAFSVDRRLGTIVVQTSRRWQNAVRAYFAARQIYPTKSAPGQIDPRVATGTLRPIDGIDSRETEAARATRQAFGSRAVDGRLAAPNLAGNVEDRYAPQYRDANELKSALTQLFGDRFQKLGTDLDANEPFSRRQVETYRFVKRRLAGEDVDRVCDVDFDALGNSLTVRGDAAVCAQMLVLLRAIDQPPLRNGNVRRFIPIRYGDPNKIRQIFEYGAQTPEAARVGFDGRDVRALGAELAQTAFENVVRESFAETAPLFAYATAPGILVAPPFEANFKSTFESKSNLALASSVSPASLPGKTRDASFVVRAGEKNGAIRQVAAQDDGGLGGLNEGASGLDSGLGGFDSRFGGFGRGGAGAGVGVVQDFVPQVLTQLDVVLVDNATEAEYERVKQMIEQIEELAKIAEPTTEIYQLKNVDGAMLHGVLTKLYAEMFATKQGRAMFYALQNPNAILVVGWGQAFDAIKDLIQLFDQPIASGAGTMRVVRLKYAAATEVAEMLTETFVRPLTDGSGGLAPRVRVFADARTNSLVVQASPNDWNEIQTLLVELDVNKASTKLVTRVVDLKNSLAENIRTTLMNVLMPAKQGTLDTSAAKFPTLELLSVDDDGRRLIESGVMIDVDVVADAYHNQLIITAPEDSVEFLEKLIETLDVAPKKAQIRFFQVRHGDAAQIMQTLQSLMATSDQNLSTPTMPQADGEETFVPVRFALDTRTNVVIAAAAPKELAIIDALVVALDVKDTQEREEVVVQLRNIQALVVAEAIDDYLAQKQTLETASEVLSNYQLYESQVIVIPESISNSIIVSAAPEYMDKILEMIRTFDQDAPQVVIQVLIAEVTLTDQEEFGIEAGLQDATSFDRSIITNATSSSSTVGDPGLDFVNKTNGAGRAMNSTRPSTNIGGQVLNNLGVKTTNSSLGYSGFVVSANSRSVSLTLRALREKNRLQVLSRPQVTAMDNQQAFILVGQRVARINGTTTTNTATQMNTVDTPVGLILLVTPRVTNDGRVIMEIGAEKSSLGDESAGTVITTTDDGQLVRSPSIDTIQAMTAVSARDGETVMLGGLLTTEKQKISRGVPYLSDVPVLGWLFRYDQETEQRKELLIVMTPRIMRGSEDIAETVRREIYKTNVNLDDAMNLNGNMGLYDPTTNRGYEPKQTRRLLNDLLCPPKMDELDNIPPYSPANDYAPRPIVETPEDSKSAPRSTLPRRRTSSDDANEDENDLSLPLDDAFRGVDARGTGGTRDAASSRQVAAASRGNDRAAVRNPSGRSFDADYSARFADAAVDDGRIANEIPPLRGVGEARALEWKPKTEDDSDSGRATEAAALSPETTRR